MSVELAKQIAHEVDPQAGGFFRRSLERAALMGFEKANADATDEIERLREQLGKAREELGWIKLYAVTTTIDNWRDMKLRIERQAKKALADDESKSEKAK